MLLTLFRSFVVLIIARASVSSIVRTRESTITLPFTSHINTNGGSLAFLEADRARLETLRHNQFEDAPKRILLPAIDSAVSYIADIGIGEPPTPYSLLIDTGSSNTWVGAGKPYRVTPTSQETNDTVSVIYGSGAFSGMEYLDTLWIGISAIRQSIGVASSSHGFQGIDGILGIGPTALSLKTLSPNATDRIPTVTDNLVSQHFTSSKVIGISFEPTNIHTSPVNGQLDFGGINPSKFTGKIHYTPITSRFPYDLYWGIDQDITYGYSTLLMTASSAIVDTGTTLLYLPHKAFSRYVKATHAVMDTSVGLLTITPKQFHELKSMFFTIGGVKYEFSANAQIWPRALNSEIGGSEDQFYLIVANGGSRLVSSINGFVWLQRFYSVFDTDKNRIGFAKTRFTAAETN